MKKLLTGTLMAMGMILLTSCGEKAPEKADEETVSEMAEETEETQTDTEENNEPEPTEVPEEVPEEAPEEVPEDPSWAEQNKIEYTPAKEMELPWYCYVELNGEKLDDVQNKDNKAVYSKPELKIEVNGDKKTYYVSYTVEASNAFVIPDSYATTDHWRGSVNDLKFLDLYSGTVIPSDYDDNEIQAEVPQKDGSCQLTVSGNMSSEKILNESEDYDQETWLHKIDYILTFNIEITVPAEKDDIVLYTCTTASDLDTTDSPSVPHLFGEEPGEVQEDCIFIKLDDLAE